MNTNFTINLYSTRSTTRFASRDISSAILLAWPYLQWSLLLFLLGILLVPASAAGEEFDWSIGGYGGQYYDTEPAGFTQGKANYLNHYIVAVTGSKTLWRFESLPLTLEVDGMIGHQFGIATLDEIAVAPVLRWSSFPWNDYLQTDFRIGPLGISYTNIVSPLERGTDGNGSHILNFFVAEFAFSLPRNPANEVFMRLHHRCAIYDLINNFGANGEDFLAFGYRYRY